MLSYLQSILLGALQGVTELFPISSLGHSVILAPVFGLELDKEDPFFLTFLVATHFATALVLFLFFYNDWKRIISGFFRSFKTGKISLVDPDSKLAWLLIVTTIPAGILGLLFEKKLKLLFASPQIVAFVLILNGILLYIAEVLRKNSVHKETETDSDNRIAELSWTQGIKVGILQCLALIPGFSRTGATITGGLLVGLSHVDAARFSFLLATPIIAAASLLKLPELFSHAGLQMLPVALVGALSSAIFAYLSVKFLTQYFETKKLTPFAIYCCLVGLFFSIYFMI